MIFNIQNKDNQENEVFFGKEKLKINIGDDAFERNDEWNTIKINDFLINLASAMEPEEKIELSISGDEKHKIFEHIISLFKAFAEEYNN